MSARVGVVVIGRNEGARLSRALDAALAAGAPLVYVDSGSTDASPADARARGVPVLQLSPPFTAARGRQAGLEELLRAHPDLALVQFIDGDCVLHPAWIPTATAFLLENPRVACVTGRRREEFPDATTYNALIDLDWDATPGPVAYPGGDSLCRVDALRAVDGWSVDLIAGEDPDLGFKLTAAGWMVHRLPDEMTLHDVNMRSFRAYWKRAVRAGYCYAQVGWKHRAGPGRPWIRRCLSALLYSVALPTLALVAAATLGPWALLALVPYARLWWTLRRRARTGGASAPNASRYATLNVACKFAQGWGVVSRSWHALVGRRPVLIEYKPGARS